MQKSWDPTPSARRGAKVVGSDAVNPTPTRNSTNPTPLTRRRRGTLQTRRRKKIRRTEGEGEGGEEGRGREGEGKRGAAGPGGRRGAIRRRRANPTRCKSRGTRRRRGAKPLGSDAVGGPGRPPNPTPTATSTYRLANIADRQRGSRTRKGCLLRRRYCLAWTGSDTCKTAGTRRRQPDAVQKSWDPTPST